MSTIDILCLANSWRPGGRCVAGLRLDGKGWVRPVPSPEGGALANATCRFPDGEEPFLLETVRIPLRKRVPTDAQPENWLLGSGEWHRGADPPQDLEGFLEPHVNDTLLFGTAGDRIAADEVARHPPGRSLTLIRLEEMHLEVRTSYTGRWRGQAQFETGGESYDLPITDPIISRRLLALGLGVHDWNDVGFDSRRLLYITASLGDPWRGACYKIAAALFQLM